MVHGRAGRNTKTSVKNRRRIVHGKPSARNQKKQILSNQNQIVALKRHVNLSKERLRWHMGFTAVSMTQLPMVIPLTSGPSTANPAVLNTVIGEIVPWEITMTPAPQSTNTIRSKCVVNTQWVDFSIYAGDESSLLSHTAFLVQLDEKNARQVYEETSSMSTLVRGRDYITPLNAFGTDSGYGAYLNNDRFKIIKRLEFETAGHEPLGYVGNPGTSTGNTGSGTNSWFTKRCQFKVNYGNTVFKSTGNGATQQSLSYSELPSPSKRFIIMFNNNITDNKPYVSLSSLITGYAPE